MNDFQTSPMLFVFIVLSISLLVALLGGWKSISVDIIEEDETKPNEAPRAPNDASLAIHSRAA